MFRKGERSPRLGMADSCSGFSIVELIIVLSIVSIMAVAALPLLNIGSHQAEAAMQSMGSMLLAAQRRAINRQHDVIVIFDVPSGTIRIIEDADNDGGFDAGEHRTAYPVGEGVVFGRGGAAAHSIGSGPITFTDRIEGQPAVTFHRDGSASQAGGIYLQAAREDSGGGSRGARLLVVDRATGRPSWYRYAGNNWERGF